MMRRRIARVLETSSQPRGALLAFLAIEGLMALEWLGLHRWQTEERGELIAEIGWLADQQPEPAAISATAWEKPSQRSKEIGRASGRGKVGQYGVISVVAGALKKKKNKTITKATHE